MKKKSIGYIVPHTHWDREWRYPLWENRFYLRDLMEELLETLEKNPEYKSFLMDGQVIAIIDYLEICPNKKEAIQKFIKAGRIQIGPWYTLPDLYPISGESIVRNLLKGKTEAEKLGGYLKIGYESFGWGQPSQLPQIYKGFDIDTVIVSKNVDKIRAPKCEFRWTGADGTSVLATRLGEDARANFFMNAYLKIMTGKEYKSEDYEYKHGKDGQIYHQADEQQSVQDYFRIENTEKIHKEYIKQSIRKAWDSMHDTLMPQNRIMMDGTDSTTCQPQLIQLLKEINEESEEIEFVSSSIAEYVSVMKEKLDFNDLIEVVGEMRDGPTTSLSGNALMTRPHIKTFNKEVQNKLFGMAEPISVIGMMLGEDYETNFLDKALNYMLLAHPHDSINGVTQDKTVADVMYRLAQANEIADAVYNRGMQNIIRNIDLSSLRQEDMVLMIFNPSAQPRSEIVKVNIDTPQDKSIWDFNILNSRGEKREIQFDSREEVISPVVHLQSRPFPYYTDRHGIYLDTGELPAGGYEVYVIKEGDHFNRKTKFWAKMRKTDGSEIATGSDVMENEYLIVQVNADGSLTITDKIKGEAYGPLNYYESAGDVGDYWMYYPPYHNKTYTSKGMQAAIFLMENGKLSATVGVELSMIVPKCGYRPESYIHGESSRSKETKEVKIRTYYTLQKGSQQVEVKIEIDNNCQDHKMSVLMETGVNTKYIDAQGHYTVDHREATPLRDENQQYYNELVTQPMQKFVSLQDGDRGMAVVTDCLGEYEYRTDDKHTLGFTLFRAVRNIICTEFRSEGYFPNQQGGQLQQTLDYHYAIMPIRGNWEENDMVGRAEKFNLPVKPIQTSVPNVQCGTLPLRYSFYEIKGNVEVSCIKKCEQSQDILLRVGNPKQVEEQVVIKMSSPITQAAFVNLAEEMIEKIEVKGMEVRFIIQPGKIKTIKIDVSETTRNQ